MKVKVLYEFVDRYTKKLHKVGEVLDIDENRFKEIQNVGNFVEKIDEEIKTEKAIKGKTKKG